MRRGAAWAIVAALACVSARASADEWTTRYEDARRRMLAGDHEDAAAELDALAEHAPSEADRRLAREMADVARALAAKAAPPPREPIRTRDEITILYASAFLYGAGTGTWYLLETQPDTALTATLPFAAITAVPVVALATIDGYHPLPRGMPHAITAGLYIGLGEGIWAASYERARAHRVDAGGPPRTRWSPETVASVLWTGSTLGAIAGGALASGLHTTPGRVSFTASTSLWSGLLCGLTAGALLPDGPRRAEEGFLAAGLCYNIGLFGGMALAGPVSPSVTRVRLVDLAGAAGALATSGMYLSLAHRDADPRVGLGVTAIGAAAGLTAGTLLTAGMGREIPGPNGTLETVSWSPTMAPVRGGVVAGIGGMM